MQLMNAAAGAELVQFNTRLVISLVLFCVVIMLFALGAGKRNYNSVFIGCHNSTSFLSLLPAMLRSVRPGPYKPDSL